MQFKPEDFCRITDTSKPSFKIRTADFTTLMLIKGSGEALYARTRGDKDQLIARFRQRDGFAALGVGGAYRTDIFMLTTDDVANH